jgi:hypothetical protein
MEVILPEQRYTHTDKMWDVPFVILLPLYAGVIVFLCRALVWCVISDFCCEVDENCALLGSWPLKMGPISCPETSVRNYHFSQKSSVLSCMMCFNSHTLNQRHHLYFKVMPCFLVKIHSVRWTCCLPWRQRPQVLPVVGNISQTTQVVTISF